MNEQEMLDHIKRLETEHYEVMITLQEYFIKQANGVDKSREDAKLRKMVINYREKMFEYLQSPHWDETVEA